MIFYPVLRLAYRQKQINMDSRLKAYRSKLNRIDIVYGISTLLLIVSVIVKAAHS